MTLRLCLLLALSSSVCLGQRVLGQQIQFNRDVRPILSENCYHCHGPDEDARAGELRLDTEEGAKEFAIVPGDVEGSELVARILSDDDELRMPPLESERSLSPEQIQTLKQWIEQGATYEGHWSFVVPQSDQPTNQPPADGARVIDQFWIEELENRQLTAAPEASRETLIRRASFDLLGIPPTLTEIDQFVADESPNAYERLLNRLLDRPEFGERMASDWLDAARYSDTYGYQVDRDRYVWPWRDWVVKAFNRNLPYDQFLTEQIAGDLVPDASRDQILATTFNRLHPQKVEGGSVPEEFRMEYVADRTQTFATAMLGLTMECCRCHNHKYDPFSQIEYYQLTAFFDKIDEAGLYSYFTPSIPTPTLALSTPDQDAKLADLKKRIEESSSSMLQWKAARIAELNSEQQPLKPTFDDSFFAEPILHLEFEDSNLGANQSVEGVSGKAVQLTGDDAVGTKVGNFRRDQPFSIAAWIHTPDLKERSVVFHRSRAWTDAGSRGYELLLINNKPRWSLIHFWPGNAISIETVDAIQTNQWVHIAVTYDGSTTAQGLRIFINGREAKTKIVRDRLTKNITGGGGDNISIGERFRDLGFKNGKVDEFQVFDVALTAFEVMRIHDLPSTEPDTNSKIDPKLTQQLMIHRVARHDEEHQEKQKSLAELVKRKCDIENSLQEIMVMREMDSTRQSYLLTRGAYDQRSKAVDPATPSVLNSFPDGQPRNRRGLARWLVDPTNPLTSRVAVNRLWQLCFGNGLVRTPEDFGSQGEPPTHPELLDWLAADLADSGWNVKRLLKQIMLSRPYRQSSIHPDRMITEVDPDNRWLARFPAYRLPAEMLRDNALAVSGRLVKKMGGPPVRPYEIEASFKPSGRTKGEGLYRRSLYTYWKRTGPAPAMMALDAAKRDVCRVQRERTSSPIQAFVLLNGPQYVEASRGLAESLVQKHGKDEVDAVVFDAFRTLTSRPPTDNEVEILKRLFQQQLELFTNNTDDAVAYLSVGDAARVASLPAEHVAAMTVVVNTVMNFDQCVMKQ